ncbi:hypothetical protein KSZ_05510 [Dictyobacter formicarum]|uniref:FHA domain-containing protein n=1 Tax=Dictyobacter formicarum TaxID=2778368 RepID=A0ABQ3V9T3_9CHLR|nr:hypothetical protein KSZ_05510 [Dictyobacter formicarum]
MRTHNFILFPRQHELEQSQRFILGLGAIDLCPGKGHHTCLTVLAPGLLNRQPDPRHLRVGKRTPGDNAIIDLLFANGKQRIAHRDSRLVGRHMGETVTANHISTGVNRIVGCLQIRIDIDPSGIIGDTSRFYIEGLTIGLSPEG